VADDFDVAMFEDFVGLKEECAGAAGGVDDFQIADGLQGGQPEIRIVGA
jgi:hypothetical protein